MNEILAIDGGFWNIRDFFYLNRFVDIKTHCSLVQRKNGNFVLLDACTLPPAIKEKVDQLTDGGKRLEAILHLHPFHTVHVENMHKIYPNAALYGTARHISRAPKLPWEKPRTESPELHALFAEDLAFTVPQGVDFISQNENLHFSSVLAYHKASKTIHVDDTLMFSKLPGLLQMVGLKNVLNFHPTLALVLQKRKDAVDEFENWVGELVANWQGAQNLCAAHTAPLLQEALEGVSIAERIERALGEVKWLLAAHRLRYG
ncbi:MAG: hypothetical protein AAF518_13875 [Spirochaetota bacterium]